MVKIQRLFAKTNLKIPVCRTDKIPLGTKGRTSILSYRKYVRPAELHSRSAEEIVRPRMFRHFVPSRELHSLATLVRLSLVDLPSANGFDKPFAASKFERKYFNLAKERKCMSKAILAAIVSLVLGVLAEASVGVRWNMTGIGCIVSVAIMGAFIIYFNDKKK